MEYSDTSVIWKKSNFEIAFTPRFAYFESFKLSPTKGFNFHQSGGQPRLQIGMRIIYNNYLHFFCDLLFRNSSDQTINTNYYGYLYGMQFERKMRSELISMKPFKVYSKNIFIKYYPNLLISVGLTKINSGVFTQTTNFNGKWNLYYAYGTGISFVIGNSFELQTICQFEYQKSRKSNPLTYRYLQTKIIYKL